MERPNRARLDYFSRCFELLDNDLSEFCQRFGWALTINPHREPGRDLIKYNRMRLHIGVSVDGDWRSADMDPDFGCSMAVSGVYDPVSDLFFYRRIVLVKRTTVVRLKHDLKTLLNKASSLADAWELPRKTEEGFYVIPVGWHVASPHSLKT